MKKTKTEGKSREKKEEGDAGISIREENDWGWKTKSKNRKELKTIPKLWIQKTNHKLLTYTLQLLFWGLLRMEFLGARKLFWASPKAYMRPSHLFFLVFSFETPYIMAWEHLQVKKRNCIIDITSHPHLPSAVLKSPVYRIHLNAYTRTQSTES